MLLIKKFIIKGGNVSINTHTLVLKLLYHTFLEIMGKQE